jgi:hypothetical protein
VRLVVRGPLVPTVAAEVLKELMVPEVFGMLGELEALVDQRVARVQACLFLEVLVVLEIHLAELEIHQAELEIHLAELEIHLAELEIQMEVAVVELRLLARLWLPLLAPLSLSPLLPQFLPLPPLLASAPLPAPRLPFWLPLCRETAQDGQLIAAPR